MQGAPIVTDDGTCLRAGSKLFFTSAPHGGLVLEAETPGALKEQETFLLGEFRSKHVTFNVLDLFFGNNAMDAAARCDVGAVFLYLANGFSLNRHEDDGTVKRGWLGDFQDKKADVNSFLFYRESLLTGDARLRRSDEGPGPKAVADAKRWLPTLPSWMKLPPIPFTPNSRIRIMPDSPADKPPAIDITPPPPDTTPVIAAACAPPGGVKYDAPEERPRTRLVKLKARLMGKGDAKEQNKSSSTSAGAAAQAAHYDAPSGSSTPQHDGQVSKQEQRKQPAQQQDDKRQLTAADDLNSAIAGTSESVPYATAPGKSTRRKRQPAPAASVTLATYQQRTGACMPRVQFAANGAALQGRCEAYEQRAHLHRSGRQHGVVPVAGGLARHMAFASQRQWPDQRPVDVHGWLRRVLLRQEEAR